MSKYASPALGFVNECREIWQGLKPRSSEYGYEFIEDFRFREFEAVARHFADWGAKHLKK